MNNIENLFLKSRKKISSYLTAGLFLLSSCASVPYDCCKTESKVIERCKKDKWCYALQGKELNVLTINGKNENGSMKILYDKEEYPNVFLGFIDNDNPEFENYIETGANVNYAIDSLKNEEGYKDFEIKQISADNICEFKFKNVINFFKKKEINAFATIPKYTNNTYFNKIKTTPEYIVSECEHEGKPALFIDINKIRMHDSSGGGDSGGSGSGGDGGGSGGGDGGGGSGGN